jgi:hypothetical protein
MRTKGLMAKENDQQKQQTILRGVFRDFDLEILKVGMVEKRSAQRSRGRRRVDFANDNFQRRLGIFRIQLLLYTAGALARHPPSDGHRV